MSTAGQSAQDYVEVYDEPQHITCLVNDYVHAYRVQLPPACTTLWHRHTQDTVYFSLSDARAGEELPDGGTKVTDVPCGAAVSRPHRADPLIHKVTNAGEQAFHLIGAEAHRRPDVPVADLAPLPGHALVFSSDRFHVYRVTTTTALEVAYHAYGLLVIAAPVTFSVGAQASAQNYAKGDLIWVTPAEGWVYPSGYSGFYAQWR